MSDEPEPSEEPQYPLPQLGGEDPPEQEERLPPPSKHARRLMADHLQEHVTERFRLERHVHLGGPRKPPQLLTWNPVNSTFRCSRCPGRVFGTGEIRAEMVEVAQLFDETLKPRLAGLTSDADREEMTRLHFSGELNRERLRSMRAGAHRRAAASSRPSVEDRRKRLQAWMLAAYAELGVVERVLDAVEELQGGDHPRWAALVGRPLSRATIKNYWFDIDPDLRAKAKRLFLRKRG